MYTVSGGFLSVARPQHRAPSDTRFARWPDPEPAVEFHTERTRGAVEGGVLSGPSREARHGHADALCCGVLRPPIADAYPGPVSFPPSDAASAFSNPTGHRIP